jgi:hypothetical protein
MKRSFRATIFLKQLNDSNKKHLLEMSIQPKPKSTERALQVQLAVLFSSFGVEQLQNRCQLDGVCRIFYYSFRVDTPRKYF